ncbi:hypothetical protein EPD60_07510 [Flaviaesturariibacter flavus]|uniref:Uncharacterized protein n=1 Tax=Flaviaesturariibacter flavus TaxID=2502780 RepID=A0A4R1BH69_9BACT|nr:hypothetical protein [Flaviaesturariibacter flavus]TCJ16580.1 hypothetical protein EPD60_07510 [Flaviaesturariibacter flavus]
MEEVNPKFDFLSEIERDRTYSLLFPTRQQGVAIIRLYLAVKNGAFPDKSFKEEDIYDALSSSHVGDEAYSRIPQEHFVELIGQLKEYFLIWDDERQVYYLKEYAFDFCRNAEKILEANFNPTKIEVLCSELLQRLKQVGGEGELTTWLEIHFDLFKPEMKSQVDFLDKQIDNTVAELRQTAGVQNESILAVLKRIDAELDRLRDQNRELRAAFRQMKIIRETLEQLSVNIDSAALFEKAALAREFFPEVKRRLSLIDRRLDRIHPKLRQFFGTLNKPLFNNRVEKFLNFLFQYSNVTYLKARKILELPSNVSLPQIYIPTAHLAILERKENLFPVKARAALDFEQNPVQAKQAAIFVQSKLKVQEEIEEWFGRILEDVKSRSKVYFSQYFFALAEAKDGNLELPIKLAHRIVRSGFFLHAYLIDVQEELIVHENFTGVAICEISISLK